MAIPQGTNWREQILKGIKAPVTPSNIQAINAWAQAEGGSATSNPFNTTQPMPGATPYNTLDSGGHVYNYATPQQGINATIQTLKGAVGNYAPILAAFRQGTDPMAVAKAVAGSQWGTGTGVERVLGGSVPTTTTPAVTVPTATPTVPTATPVAVPKMNVPAAKPLAYSSASDFGNLFAGAAGGDTLNAAFTNRLLNAVNRSEASGGTWANPKSIDPRAAVQQAAKPTQQGATAGGMPVEIEGKVTKRALQAVKLAEDYLGTPYSWGGGSPAGPGYGVDQGANIKGFDCSSLLQFVWAKQGVNIPRVTYDQWDTGKRVGKASLQAGDAVFFHPGPQGPEHVGMYIGQGKFIEAPHTGAEVRISNLAGRKGYMGARRYG